LEYIPSRGKKFCKTGLETTSGAHPATHSVVTDGYFPRLKGLELEAYHFHLMLRLLRLELYTHSTICLPGKVLFNLLNPNDIYIYIYIYIYI